VHAGRLRLSNERLLRYLGAKERAVRAQAIVAAAPRALDDPELLKGVIGAAWTRDSTWRSPAVAAALLELHRARSFGPMREMNLFYPPKFAPGLSALLIGHECAALGIAPSRAMDGCWPELLEGAVLGALEDGARSVPPELILRARALGAPAATRVLALDEAAGGEIGLRAKLLRAVLDLAAGDDRAATALWVALRGERAPSRLSQRVYAEIAAALNASERGRVLLFDPTAEPIALD
jgi:hypothetical protein